jgi:tetratricopeptide (TPR) repeat protein
VLSLALLTPGAAAAQSSHIEASIRAAQARAAARRGDVSEAVRLFRESVELNPSPRVLRELAETLERQGDLRNAAAAWGRYAALAPQASERELAIVRRENLRRTASLLRVRVSPALAAREARVWFDRDPPRPVPAGGAESFVEGGTHRVRVESPGYLPFETMVATAFGEPVEIVARLQRVGGGDTAAIPAPPAMPAMPTLAPDAGARRDR